MVNAFSKKEPQIAPIYALYDHVFNMCLESNNFTCSFVRQKGNTVAHMIAKWDMGSAQAKIYMDPFPPSHLALVELDLISLLQVLFKKNANKSNSINTI